MGVPGVIKAAPCANGTNPGRTHRFYTGKAVVPFGFGLSYTSFRYTIAEGPSSLTVGQGSTTFVVRVTNTGEKDADEVVLWLLMAAKCWKESCFADKPSGSRALKPYSSRT